MAMLLGKILGGLISVWACYIVFAGIFKHKAGFCITTILFSAYSIIIVTYAKDVGSVIAIIISLLLIGFIPKLQIRNYKKGENAEFHYYWYKGQIVRRNMKNFSFDFEFYKNNEWVKDDNFNKQFSEDVRISKVKYHENIYLIAEEKATELIDNINKKPETKD